ncbi:MAG: cation:proton antiporter [Peptoniphilaceae bacterium]|uniref:cation:proton antiporter n=1 Tax=Parvimonas sp. TaxID=1944660 RepID=UPI0025F7CB4F|nr:cation:proton antiporter [Parvimonas sp.]MCI5997540.1 cation:proton antiporter [Parvimonas sp.]MDD7765518.1 cation:proton antiporter [Peptoniphilaceae bacterium]MDY3051059.1 cation:proton antiporter [Parvimonas sp.]
MLTSLAFIFIIGMGIAGIFEKLKLPRIIGMLLAGIILGPHTLNLLDGSIMEISSDLREMALVIILLRAGISLNIKDLLKVGRPAILMSCIPALFEIFSFSIFGPYFLNITKLEGAIIGSILGAVSPAIVVPKMVYLMDKKYGTKKSIPQLILAGSSLDDVFVIVLFSTFVNLERGGSGNIMSFVNIPVSILTGIGLGILFGSLFASFLEMKYHRDEYIRNSKKIILLLGLSFLLIALEQWLKNFIPVSGLIAVMTMASFLKIKTTTFVSERIAEKLGKIWIASEIVLFVLVGAAVNISYTLKAGYGALLMIFISLFFRSIGVFICMLGTNLNFKEILFCIISYIPKATVQAVIGSIPLSLGLNCGEIALSVAVMSIIITAPLGAILIELSYKKLLTVDV